MKNEKNVLITSVNPYLHYPAKLKYYYREESDGESKYCTALSDQEAGAKRLLSSHKIDEIIVVGSQTCCPEELQLKRIELKKTNEIYKTKIAEESIYPQYTYRLAQYLNNVDIEMYELLEVFTKEEQEIVIKYAEEIALKILGKYEDSDRSRVFHYFRLDEGDTHSLLKEYIADKNELVVEAILGLAYTWFNSYYKMRPLLNNDDVGIWFSPISKGLSDSISISNIVSIFDWFLQNDDENTIINIYLDTQGLNQTDALALFYVVSILSKQNNNLYLKDYMTTNPYYNYLIRKIHKSMRTVALNDLSSGINDFINYGKADMLVKYWIEDRTPSNYVKEFVYAMKKIDVGISLCNYNELEYGIKKIKKLVHQGYTPNMEDFESGLFQILLYGIIDDYGPLLEDDSEEIDVFELIKWAYRKKYYQQAVTFIESQIPDDIVAKGIWYYAKDEDDKNKVLDMLGAIYNNTDPKQRYKFEHVPHFMVKYEGRDYMPKSIRGNQKTEWLIDYKLNLLNNDPNNAYQAYTVIDDHKLIENCLRAYLVTCDNRNTINHAEKGDDSIEGLSQSDTTSVIWDTIENLIKYFINNYQQAVDAAEGKVFTSCPISKSEVSDAAYKQKKTNNRGGKRKPSKYSIACPGGVTAHCEDIQTWLVKYAHKHPELMDEYPDVVEKELLKTRDEFVNNGKEITYKGYRLLPVEYDKNLVKE